MPAFKPGGDQAIPDEGQFLQPSSEQVDALAARDLGVGRNRA